MTCIIVLGCHRSGTSAVSGVLHHLGVNMGKELLGPSPGNPKGHFEDKELLDLHDEAIGDWQDPALDFEKVRFRYAEAIREREKQILWGFKDPRLCYLLPDVLEVIHCQVKIVDVRRIMSAVTASLATRDDMQWRDAHDLVVAYQVAKQESLSRFRGLVYSIQYDDLVENTRAEVEYLAEFVGVPFREEAVTFVDPNLRHYACTS